MGERRRWRAGADCKPVVVKTELVRIQPLPQSIVAQRLEHPVVSRAGTGSSPVDTAKQRGGREVYPERSRGESRRYCNWKGKQMGDCIKLEIWRAVIGLVGSTPTPSANPLSLKGRAVVKDFDRRHGVTG